MFSDTNCGDPYGIGIRDFEATMPEPTYTLHPDTDPDTIRAGQREDVRWAVGEGYDTPEAISPVVVLPVGVVRWRLAELGLLPERFLPCPPKAKGTARRPRGTGHPLYLKTVEQVRACLRARGPATAPEIARATGLSTNRVTGALLLANGFKVAGLRPVRRGRPARIWGLADAA